nr:hypothetical protein [uncultured Draconibacterium sp.]
MKTAGIKAELNFVTLWRIIKWRFGKKKYLNRYTYYAGKSRKITGEDFETVRLKGVKNPIPKKVINLTFNKKPGSNKTYAKPRRRK